ncbi:sigma-54-dependent transcriptional regulator [Candidatus Magnetomonas plexicatena]|uniref:sigma-54-dependent transcriptional regulator n=1 Tax=Candidatus Magnetomonas plexicatena TaxID=2552947 RepID=UPI001C76E1A1|nr:sigma-54-dependent Fis family transcriptional regulator [Nitrospirales bacterium LBB_01]
MDKKEKADELQPVKAKRGRPRLSEKIPGQYDQSVSKSPSKLSLKQQPYGEVVSCSVLDKSTESAITFFTRDDAMKQILNDLKGVAKTNYKVLIHGLQGCGKTLMARMIHNLSERANSAFVEFDTKAIAPDDMESFLFGQTSLLSKANHGTLYIKDFLNMPVWLLEKLVAAVDSHRYVPVGGVEPENLNVRLITSVSKDIKSVANSNDVTENLLYRLSDFFLPAPPLKDRAADVKILFDHFLANTCANLKIDVPVVSNEAYRLMDTHDWPGNIAEVKSIAKNAVLKAAPNMITIEHIMFLKQPYTLPQDGPLRLKEVISGVVATYETNIIRELLERFKGNKSKVSRYLAIDYKTLLNKIKEHNI